LLSATIALRARPSPSGFAGAPRPNPDVEGTIVVYPDVYETPCFRTTRVGNGQFSDIFEPRARGKQQEPDTSSPLTSRVRTRKVTRAHPPPPSPQMLAKSRYRRRTGDPIYRWPGRTTRSRRGWAGRNLRSSGTRCRPRKIRDDSVAASSAECKCLPASNIPIPVYAGNRAVCRHALEPAVPQRENKVPQSVTRG
jgi:hypothetical protein